MENQVATITSRIALALEKMADEKAGAMREMKNMQTLLEEGFKEKAALQGQVLELSRVKREGYAASPRGAVDTSLLQAKVDQLTHDLEKARLESTRLQEECEAIRNSVKHDLSEKEKVVFNIVVRDGCILKLNVRTWRLAWQLWKTKRSPLNRSS